MATINTRGGARNTGRMLSNNRSGVAGIWFQRRLGQGADPVWHVYVCCAYTDKDGVPRRTAFSVQKYGAEGAMVLAIARRVQSKLPVPPDLEAVERALGRAMKEWKECPLPQQT